MLCYAGQVGEASGTVADDEQSQFTGATEAGQLGRVLTTRRHDLQGQMGSGAAAAEEQSRFTWANGVGQVGGATGAGADDEQSQCTGASGAVQMAHHTKCRRDSSEFKSTLRKQEHSLLCSMTCRAACSVALLCPLEHH